MTVATSEPARISAAPAGSYGWRNGVERVELANSSAAFDESEQSERRAVERPSERRPVERRPQNDRVPIVPPQRRVARPEGAARTVEGSSPVGAPPRAVYSQWPVRARPDTGWARWRTEVASKPPACLA